MKSILRDIYNGKLYPAEQNVPHNKGYWSIQRAISKEKEYWMQRLSEEEYKTLEERLLYNHDMLMSMEAEEAYVCGFRMGAMVMAEILDDNAEEE